MDKEVCFYSPCFGSKSPVSPSSHAAANGRAIFPTAQAVWTLDLSTNSLSPASWCSACHQPPTPQHPLTPGIPLREGAKVSPSSAPRKNTVSSPFARVLLAWGFWGQVLGPLVTGSRNKKSLSFKGSGVAKSSCNPTVGKPGTSPVSAYPQCPQRHLCAGQKTELWTASIRNS